MPVVVAESAARLPVAEAGAAQAIPTPVGPVSPPSVSPPSEHAPVRPAENPTKHVAEVEPKQASETARMADDLVVPQHETRSDQVMAAQPRSVSDAPNAGAEVPQASGKTEGNSVAANKLPETRSENAPAVVDVPLSSDARGTGRVAATTEQDQASESRPMTAGASTSLREGPNKTMAATERPETSLETAPAVPHEPTRPGDSPVQTKEGELWDRNAARSSESPESSQAATPSARRGAAEGEEDAGRGGCGRGITGLWKSCFSSSARSA